PYLEPWVPGSDAQMVVPARPGVVFALPGWDRFYPQILMAGGIDRSYQITRCFRRGSVSGPGAATERTVLELTAAFFSVDDLIRTFEHLLGSVRAQLRRGPLDLPLSQITYADAMEQYGTSQPDTRNDLVFKNLTKIVQGSGIDPLRTQSIPEGVVYALKLPEVGDLIDDDMLESACAAVEEMYTGPGSAHWYRIADDRGVRGPSAGELSSRSAGALRRSVEGEAGDVILAVASTNREATLAGAGTLRREFGKFLDRVDSGALSILWVRDAPFFRAGVGDGEWKPVSSPRLMPDADQLESLRRPEIKGVLRAQSLELVLDGDTVAKGGVFNHDPAILRVVGRMAEDSDEAVEERFGPLLNAFRHGAPPHAVLRVDMDALLALMWQLGEHDPLAAFPKDDRGRDLWFGAPSPADEEHLRSLLEPQETESEGEDEDDEADE
ncbi:amino acid--tRNA ligase-related protein, partial [Planctomycetota bacterium]